MKLSMYLISKREYWRFHTQTLSKRRYGVLWGFVLRYVSNEHRVQGLPVRFVGNTIMEGIDQIGFASLWTVLIGLCQ